MIFVVDSDPAGLEETKNALEPEGYEVATFESAESAIELLMALEEPELIVSEIELSGMDGFEFKKAYSRKFPNSLTPFVLLSTRSDEASIGRGLALGVDDCIVKPISPKLLALKIRSILSRKNHYLIHTFYGDISKLQFFKLMQFCESKGLTGEVEVVGEETDIIISFKAGQLQSDITSDEALMKIFDLTRGTFIVRSMPTDYGDLKQYAVEEREVQEVAPDDVYSDREKPMGKLSGIQLDKRLLQLQTEFVTQPSNQLTTIVVLDGRVVQKKITSMPAGKRPKVELERLIEQQHNEVEAELRQKLSGIVEQKKATLSSTESPQERFKRLFETGFEKYRAEDFKAALTAWEEAYGINPMDKTLETNIRILKKKLDL